MLLERKDSEAKGSLAKNKIKKREGSEGNLSEAKGSLAKIKKGRGLRA
jgi:hypothetical protein